MANSEIYQDMHDACFPDSVVGFQPYQHVEVEFIQHWLGFLQKQLEETAPEVAQKNINLAILRDLDVIVPDKALQMKFKDIIKKVRELKEKYYNFPDIQSVLSSFHLSKFYLDTILQINNYPHH
ncbi:Uncharacterised protein [Raoultella terrigena]|uniref:Uncharacterized protein n=1 Tax=Raoultella terrigena TaxID=577 RepID=A0A7Z8ZEI6_RAOTE|nr:Uncharacterised protein [Raoultella terrigena]